MPGLLEVEVHLVHEVVGDDQLLVARALRVQAGRGAQPRTRSERKVALRRGETTALSPHAAGVEAQARHDGEGVGDPELVLEPERRPARTRFALMITSGTPAPPRTLEAVGGARVAVALEEYADARAEAVHVEARVEGVPRSAGSETSGRPERSRINVVGGGRSEIDAGERFTQYLRRLRARVSDGRKLAAASNGLIVLSYRGQDRARPEPRGPSAPGRPSTPDVVAHAEQEVALLVRDVAGEVAVAVTRGCARPNQRELLAVSSAPQAPLSCRSRNAGGRASTKTLGHSGS